MAATARARLERAAAEQARLYEMQARLPAIAREMPLGLRRLHAADGMDRILAALWRDGAVVLEGAVDAAVCDRVLEELRPYIDEQGKVDRKRDMTHGGSLTKRLGAIVARAPSSWGMVAHPRVLDVCRAVLGQQLLHMTKDQLVNSFRNGSAKRPQAFKFQCHLHQLIQIGPGNEPQPFHEDLSWEYNFDAQLEPEVSTMWALSDFSERNGATRLVLGSHRRRKQDGYQAYKDAERTAAHVECPKGSVVIFLGHMIHSGGRNMTDLPRSGLNVDYCLAWLRQECNQYLDVPPSVARTLPANIQKLIGYRRAHNSLGYYGAYRDPEESFADDKPVNWASQHLPQLTGSDPASKL